MFDTDSKVVVAPLVVVELMTKAFGFCAEVDAASSESQVPANGVVVPMTTVEVAVRLAVEMRVDEAPPLNIRSEVVAL